MADDVHCVARRTVLAVAAGARPRGYALRSVVAAARGGPVHAAWSIVDQFAGHVFDRRYATCTSGLVTTESLGIDAPGNHDHAPTGVLAFRRLIRDLPSSAFAGTFVDYGSGMGRVLLMAAPYPFRAIIGVELSERLVAAARQNLARTGLAQDGRFSVWHGNAADFRLPEDARVLYLFNPFHGDVLVSALDQLRMSLVSRPRTVFVVVLNPVHFASAASGRPWLVPVRRYKFDFDATLYRADPRLIAAG